MQTKSYRFVDLLETIELTKNGFRLFQPITFANGRISLSIQASYAHYCNPRQTVNKIFYNTFEIMMDEQYAPEHWNDLYDTMGVYGYVPCDEIEKLVEELDEKYGLDNNNEGLIT